MSAAHHLTAARELTRFVDGHLDAASRRELAGHLRHCKECREWVETYRLLADCAVAAHPASDELARFALAAGSLDAAAREECARHVEDCAQCAEEVALARGAAGRVVAPAPVPARSFARRYAWAAGLLLVTGVALVGLSIGTTPELPEQSMLSESRLTDETVVQARSTILVETTSVAAGGELTLRSGGTVTFGDGFSVDSGGTLLVVVDGRYGS